MRNWEVDGKYEWANWEQARLFEISRHVGELGKHREPVRSVPIIGEWSIENKAWTTLLRYTEAV